ncbi:MAG: hypothetical protein ACOC0N_03925 [Chroococcales cyanobacterium]
MIKHYVLSIDPYAQHDWDRCVLRNPISGQRPNLAEMVAEAVENEAGSYLVSVNVEVQVLEKETVPNPEQLSLNLPLQAMVNERSEVVASRG